MERIDDIDRDAQPETASRRVYAVHRIHYKSAVHLPCSFDLSLAIRSKHDPRNKRQSVGQSKRSYGAFIGLLRLDRLAWGRSLFCNVFSGSLYIHSFMGLQNALNFDFEDRP